MLAPSTWLAGLTDVIGQARGIAETGRRALIEPHTVRASVIVASAALCVATVGCGADAGKSKSGGNGGSRGRQATACRRSANRPANAKGPVRFSRRPVAKIVGPSDGTDGSQASSSSTLGEQYLYFASHSISAERLCDGKRAWRLPVQHVVDPVADLHRSGAVDEPGKPTELPKEAVAPFVTQAPGQGTTQSQHAISVVAANKRTGKDAWTAKFGTGYGNYPDDLGMPAIKGANSRYIVVSAERDSDEVPGSTAIIDARNGRVTWKSEHFYATTLHNSTVVGISGRNAMEGHAASDGHRVWKAHPNAKAASDGEHPKIETEGTSPDLTAVTAPGLLGAPKTIFVGSNGRIVRTMNTDLSHCDYDQMSSFICGTGSSQSEGTGSSLYGIDSRTARTLWKLPDGKTHRVAPKVQNLWHGRIYGTANGNVVLDARTGRELGHAPHILPNELNSNYAIEGGAVYRAEG